MTRESAAVSSARTDYRPSLSGSASLENAVVTNDMCTTAGRQIAFTFIPALAILTLVLATAAIARTPIGYMTRDMATILGRDSFLRVLARNDVLRDCAPASDDGRVRR
jgi:hypothetical protein